MAAITVNTPRKHRNGHAGAIKPYVVKNLEVIPAGAFVGLDADGYLCNWIVNTGASFRYVGMAMEKVTGDGTLTCSVNGTGIELRRVAVTGASTIADLTPGAVYLANNNDLTIAAPAAGAIMGRIVKFYSATEFDVKTVTPEEYAANAQI